jgi:CheY-like chemotaxis protein
MMPPPGTRVLIVEDEAIIAMTAEDMIEEMGCVVAGVAASIPEALAHAEAGAFDVVLLDINLNGAASTAVAELLAARALPFIFTTGYGPSGPAPGFANIPVVPKPYRADQIGLAICHVLGRASAA